MRLTVPMTDLLSAPTFELSGEGVQARAQVRGTSFVVQKESHARAQSVPSFEGHSYAALRGTLIQEGKLAPDPADPQRLIYLEDVAYSTPSAAAQTWWTPRVPWLCCPLASASKPCLPRPPDGIPVRPSPISARRCWSRAS